MFNLLIYYFLILIEKFQLIFKFEKCKNRGLSFSVVLNKCIIRIGNGNSGYFCDLN